MLQGSYKRLAARVWQLKKLGLGFPALLLLAGGLWVCLAGVQLCSEGLLHLACLGLRALLTDTTLPLPAGIFVMFYAVYYFTARSDMSGFMQVCAAC